MTYQQSVERPTITSVTEKAAEEHAYNESFNCSGSLMGSRDATSNKHRFAIDFRDSTFTYNSVLQKDSHNAKKSNADLSKLYTDMI